MAEVELKVEQMGDFKDGGTKMKLTTRAVYYINAIQVGFRYTINEKKKNKIRFYEVWPDSLTLSHKYSPDIILGMLILLDVDRHE